MIGTYQNKFCDSIYRLFYREDRVFDKEGKPTKRTTSTLYAQRISSVVNPEPGDLFKPDIDVWETHIQMGRFLKISDE